MKHMYVVMVMVLVMGCDVFIGTSSDSNTPPTFSIVPIRAGNVSSITVKVSEIVGLEKSTSDLPQYFTVEHSQGAFSPTDTITVNDVNFAFDTFTLNFDTVQLTAGDDIRVTIRAGIVSDFDNNLNAQTAIAVKVQ